MEWLGTKTAALLRQRSGKKTMLVTNRHQQAFVGWHATCISSAHLEMTSPARGPRLDGPSQTRVGPSARRNTDPPRDQRNRATRRPGRRPPTSQGRWGKLGRAFSILDAKVVDTGENLMVLIPDDLGVFYGQESDRDHLACTNLGQTHVDLWHCGKVRDKVCGKVPRV